MKLTLLILSLIGVVAATQDLSGGEAAHDLESRELYRDCRSTSDCGNRKVCVRIRGRRKGHCEPVSTKNYYKNNFRNWYKRNKRNFRNIGCRNHDDCPDNLKCDKDWRVCVPRSGYSNWRYYNDWCENSDDCDKGERCDKYWNICVPKSGTQRYYTRGGKRYYITKNGSRHCEEDSECGRNLKCKGSRCVDK